MANIVMYEPVCIGSFTKYLLINITEITAHITNAHSIITIFWDFPKK